MKCVAHRLAEQDLLEAIAYYEEQAPGLGAELLAVFETGIREERRVALVEMGREAGYASIRSALDALLRELGGEGRCQPLEHPSFVPGRDACATPVGSRTTAQAFQESEDMVQGDFGKGHRMGEAEVSQHIGVNFAAPASLRAPRFASLHLGWERGHPCPLRVPEAEWRAGMPALPAQRQPSRPCVNQEHAVMGSFCDTLFRVSKSGGPDYPGFRSTASRLHSTLGWRMHPFQGLRGSSHIEGCKALRL